MAVGLTDEQILRSKLDRRKTEQSIQTEENRIAGEAEGVQIINALAADLAADDIEFGSDEFIDRIAAARAASGNPHAQKILDSFVDRERQNVATTSSVAAQGAQTRVTTSQANVLEATEDLRIEAQRLANTTEAERAANLAANTARVEGDTRLAELQETRDPRRVELAQKIWPFVDSWKTARETAGLGAGGIPDDEAAPLVLTQGNAGGEAAIEAANFARQMIPANTIINSLTRDRTDEQGNITQGTRVRFTTAIQRAAGSETLVAALNNIADPEQQKVLQAGLQYNMAYRFFMSGQQSSDKEYLNMMKVTLEQTGDSDAVIRQKRIMRQHQIDAVNTVAGGIVSPLPLIDRTIELFRSEGGDQRFIDFLVNERRLVARRLRLEAAGRGEVYPVSSEPGTVNPIAVDSLMGLFTTVVPGAGGKF